MKLFTTFTILLIGLVSAPANAQDSVFLNSGPAVRGTIEMLTPETLRVGERTIPIRDIRSMKIGGAPSGIERASKSIEKDQFNDAWATLQGIDEAPTQKIALMEYRYLEAFLLGKQATLGQGGISVNDARNKLGTFISTYPTSYRLNPIVEMYGQLSVSVNEVQVAETAFKKLASSTSPEFQIRGLFNLGQVQLLNGNFAAAGGTFGELENHQSNDAVAQNYKLIAQAQGAKARVFNNPTQADQEIQNLESIIQNQDPDNKQLFAYCYNALGSCHLAKNERKAAAIAYLHTDLLFFTEPDAHAEALYNLAKLWKALEETDRANSARSLLSQSYANSLWKLKLDQEARQRTP